MPSHGGSAGGLGVTGAAHPGDAAGSRSRGGLLNGKATIPKIQIIHDCTFVMMSNVPNFLKVWLLIAPLKYLTSTGEDLEDIYLAEKALEY